MSEFTHDGDLVGAEPNRPKFSVRKFDGKAELRNNFVRLDVTAERVSITCYKIEDESSVSTSWRHTIERSSLE